MTPEDFSLIHAAAVVCLLVCWFSYSLIFRLLGKESLNDRLAMVRKQWMKEISHREGKPFDAIMLGHIVHSVAFFGSATLIVLAGIFSIIAGLEALHATVTRLHFIANTSLELFAVEYALVASVLTLSFFSFTYALRKLIYAIALIGALPDKPDNDAKFEALIENTTTVLTEALKTFNFGIRGYYYAIAAMFLFVSPYACIVASLVITIALVYRQIGSKTSTAIVDYIELSKKQD